MGRQDGAIDCPSLTLKHCVQPNHQHHSHGSLLSLITQQFVLPLLSSFCSWPTHAASLVLDCAYISIREHRSL